jgi:hypothetical protein
MDLGQRRGHLTGLVDGDVQIVLADIDISHISSYIIWYKTCSSKLTQHHEVKYSESID